jgi:hypothetical protein
LVGSVEAIIEAMRAHAATHGISREHFELQMLFGVRRDPQRSLMRVFV